MMPKPKSYDVIAVKQAIKNYFFGECHGDKKRLVMTEICKHLNVNGFPNVNDRKLNRDQEIKTLIKALKETPTHEVGNRIISYSPLKIDEFIKTNNSIGKLRKGLLTLDNYYAVLAEEAINLRNESITQVSVNKKLNDKLKVLEYEKEELLLKFKELRRNVRELTYENRQLKNSIKDTLLPEIANEILRRDDVLFNGTTAIKEEVYDDIVVEDTAVFKKVFKEIDSNEQAFHNKVVSTLYDALDE